MQSGARPASGVDDFNKRDLSQREHGSGRALFHAGVGRELREKTGEVKVGVAAWTLLYR